LFCALVSIFDQPYTLAHTLESLIGVIDKVLIMDGAYEDWPSKNDVSDEETLHVIERYKQWLNIEYDAAPRLSEVEKKNRNLSKLEAGDIALLIDADEIAIGLIREGFERARDMVEYDCWTLHYIDIKPGSRMVYRPIPWIHPRLLRYKPGMHYEETHWIIKDLEGKRYDQTSEAKRINEFFLIHLSFLHTKLYEEQRRIYNYKMTAKGWKET